MSRVRDIALLVVAVLALGIGALTVAGKTDLNPALRPAETAAGQVAIATTSVYVSLRAINAALSVAQDIELGASFGAQASLRPLQVLEPIDDTVERVSTVVFAVAAGAALALVGFVPVAAIGMFLFGLGLLGVLACRVWPGAAGIGPSCRRAASLGFALAIVLPLGFWGGVKLGEVLTRPAWDTAMAELDGITAQAETLIGATAQPEAAGSSDQGVDQGFWGRARTAGESVGNYTRAASVFFERADALFGATLTIIGIFTLRTVVLPILLLWGAMTLMRQGLLSRL